MSLLRNAVIALIGAAAIITALLVVTRIDGKDTGVQACELMAERAAVASKSSDSPMTNDEYQKLRKVFEDSQYESIRESGTAFIDITWQVSSIKKDDPAILMYAQQIITRYSDLVTACADNGVVLPSLAELDDGRKEATSGN